MIKIILITILLLTLLMSALFAYHGYFNSYDVSEKEVGPYIFATKRFIGGYYKVGPTMTEVDTELRKIGVSSTKGVGVFYDDPSIVKEDQLRSDVGNVLENVDDTQMIQIKEKFQIIEIPKQQAIVVDFPIKSPLSYMLAPMKVYPIINQYWSDKGYPAKFADGYSLEIYDMEAKVTRYIMLIPDQ